MKKILSFLILIIIVTDSCKNNNDNNENKKENNYPISVALKDQDYPKVISDGAGNVIIVWTDYRNTSADIFAQKVDKNVTPLWNINGTAVTTAENGQGDPRICSDDSGGVIIAWGDSRISQDGTNQHIYVQRINSSGDAAWPTNGVIVSAGSGNQGDQAITPDEAGGAIIAWADNSNGDENTIIYTQRVDNNGIIQWTTNGVPISTGSSNKLYVDVISDGYGGAIVVWIDKRNGEGNADIYAQKVNNNGEVGWDINGVAIITDTGEQWYPKLVADGEGGAIITWWDTANSDIYAQRIDSSGVIQWSANGVPIAASQGSQESHDMILDGFGKVIITWQDYRSGIDNDIYAQKIDINGTKLWTENGIIICDDLDSQRNPKLAPDGEGGAIITWEVYRNYYDVYAQRVNSSGNIQWAPTGVAISTEAESQWGPNIATFSDFSGAMVVWTDFRNDNTVSGRDIYANFISAEGILK